jgi:hypothetical protein
MKSWTYATYKKFPCSPGLKEVIPFALPSAQHIKSRICSKANHDLSTHPSLSNTHLGHNLHCSPTHLINKHNCAGKGLGKYTDRHFPSYGSPYAERHSAGARLHSATHQESHYPITTRSKAPNSQQLPYSYLPRSCRLPYNYLNSCLRLPYNFLHLVSSHISIP